MSFDSDPRYENRTYRTWITNQEEMLSLRVSIDETDLLVRVERGIADPGAIRQKIETIVRRERRSLEDYIERQPIFLDSLTPVTVVGWAPRIVKHMAIAAEAAGVGPMAAVAGALATAVGAELATTHTEVIVENGGDIYITASQPRTITVFAGDSPFTGRLGILLRPHLFPLGVCSSSGTVGHSLSFGSADCATVIAKDAALADAAATALGNRIAGVKDLKPAVEWVMTIPGVIAGLAIKNDQLAVQGSIELVRLPGPGR